MSDKNEGPTCMARDSKKGIAEAIRLMGASALRYGWKKNRGGWTCPKCYTILQAGKTHNDAVCGGTPSAPVRG